MTYLPYLCLFADIGALHILYLFLFGFSSSSVPDVASFSGLSKIDYRLGIL